MQTTVERVIEEGSIHEAKLQYFLHFSSFQYVYIMSELYPKINGKRGCFYSKYSHVGISWARTNRSSLMWDVCYYSFDPIQGPEYIGKWEHVKHSINYYRSPVFKVSRNDIHFAATLPYRYISMHASIVPLISTSEVRVMEERLSWILMCWADSSWRTSVIAGTSRFTTCCHMSKSGDLQTLFEKGLTNQQQLRFPDFLYLKLMVRYLKNYKHVPYTETPLFRLPVSLMSLEKDLPQGMNWHVRKANHDNDCMRKIVENHREEIATRHDRLTYFKTQLALFQKLIDVGITQEEFDTFMDVDPNCTTLNLVFFIVMIRLSRQKDEKVAPMKPSQKAALWPMMTDHHSMVFDEKVKTGRVRELLGNVIKDYKTKYGFYELLTQQLEGRKLKTVYAMHMKDAKSADRDISIMDIRSRPFQYFTESLVSLYNNSTDEDMMSDPEKYTKVVNMCMTALRHQKVVASSEDRSNFCGHMHPELMGLGVFLTGQEYGSTGLKGAGSVLMTNTTRDVIFPFDFTEVEMLENLDYTWVLRTEGKEQKKVPRLKLNIHMMQGIYANTGGLINTICVTGLAETMRLLSENKIITTCATTSDDVVRIVEYNRPYNVSEVQKVAVDMPNDMLKYCMMKENLTKPIVSSNIAEFNNIVITKDGMVPQAPIHSALVLQPIYGATPMADLITIVSNARSSLFWGDSPDLAESALFGGLEMLRQKWLIGPTHWDQLYQYRLIPSSLSELLSGFFPRDKRALAAMWQTLEPEVRDQVKSGMLSISSACHIFADDQEHKSRLQPSIKYLPDTLHRFKRLAHSIGVMRKVSSRLNPRYIQPTHFTKRRNAMELTMNLLTQEAEPLDPEVEKLLLPPRIKTHVERHMRRDQKPTRMGMSSIVNQPSLSKIRASRFCKTSTGNPLTDEELKISELSVREFEAKETELERISRHQGISFKAPGGLPLTRIFDGRIFRVPMSFNFSVHLDVVKSNQDQPFMYRGNIVKDFRTCLWGTDSLKAAEGCKLAFGYGKISGTMVAFFKNRNKPVLSVEIEDVDEPQIVENRLGQKVAVFLGLDPSPIGSENFDRSVINEAYLPGVTGDITAILNHGSYLLSKQKGGFNLYRQLYAKYRSEMPTYCQKYMLDYPTYLEPTISLGTGNTTILIGSFSSLYLKLDLDLENKGTVKIDLTTETPKLITDVEPKRSFSRRR